MKARTDAKRDIERTRRRILDAAAKEFAEHGRRGARVDDIARRARVNKAMIYYIFKSKDDLHLAVFESLFEEKTMNIDDKINAEQSSTGDLLKVLSLYFDSLMERPDYARIVLHDMATGAVELRKLRKKRPDLFGFFDKASLMLERLDRQKIIRGLDPDRSVLVIIMVLMFLASMGKHMDIVAPKGSSRHKDLGDLDKWKAFFAELMMRAVGPVPQ